MNQNRHFPLIEDGVVVGTGSNKYEMRNPVGKYLLYQFDQAITKLVSQIKPKNILEVGCGEGHITQILSQTNASLHCIDISDKILEIAKNRVNYSRISFEKKSIYDLRDTDQATLVVCCEVLEHLEHPQIGLEKLASVAKPYCILSVPREPIFRTLNFLRGAYLTKFGNSPGHIQHWSRRGFIKLVETKFEILSVKALLPWTVILAQTK
ncbi:methyltransferase domain-containing protein [Gloeocapsa sp. BRSZ]